MPAITLSPIRTTIDHVYVKGVHVASFKQGDLITVTDSMYSDRDYPAMYRHKSDKSGAIIEFYNGQRTRAAFTHIKHRSYDNLAD